MQHMYRQPTMDPARFGGTGETGLARLYCSARRHIAQYLDALSRFWGQHPADHFWPPHP